jgi:hypothetical protein
MMTLNGGIHRMMGSKQVKMASCHSGGPTDVPLSGRVS